MIACVKLLSFRHPILKPIENLEYEIYRCQFQHKLFAGYASAKARQIIDLINQWYRHARNLFKYNATAGPYPSLTQDSRCH